MIVLSDSERSSLEKMIQPTMQYRYVQRAKVILMASEGKSNDEIIAASGLAKVAVCKWKKRFVERRIDGLKDLPRSGAPTKYTHNDVLKVINTACSNQSKATHWTVRSLAGASGTGMKKSRVHQILKSLDLKPHQYQMWLFSSRDPEFERKEMEICGLYINPPENSVVLCVDEKPAIQALERLHAPEMMRQGKPEKIDFHYRRHGVLNLFAAFNVSDGKVYGKTAERKKAPDFLEFLKNIYTRWSDPSRRTLHIVIDNYGTHTSHLVTEWIDTHTDVKLHFTPSHASWLNQIELWFSILYRRALQRSDFKSKEDLAARLIKFIEHYNEEAKPFAWTYKGRPLRIR
jgi:putative transposase